MKEKCQLNNFGFICNNNVSRNYLWKDAIHYFVKGTNILAGNFVNFLNYFVLNRNQNTSTINIIWRSTIQTKVYCNQTSDNLISAGSVGISNYLTKNNGRKNHTELTNLSQKCSNDEHECSINHSSAISVLDEIRTKNKNSLIIDNLNIDSLSSKFEQLEILLKGKLIS